MVRVLSVCTALVMLVACAGGTGGGAGDGGNASEGSPAAQAAGWRQPSPDGRPATAGDSDVEAGRYLAVAALCNYCHTANWQPKGDVPVEQWLAGNPVGWEGPWGVTFASNLRLRAQEWTEDQWVQTLKTRKEREPMPWSSVNQMSENDARALYRFLKSLGPAGEHTPAPIGPGEPIPQSYTSMRVWDANTTLQAVAKK